MRTTAGEGTLRLRWSMPAIGVVQQATTSFESLASFSATSIAVQTVAAAGGAAQRDSPIVSLPEQIDGEIVGPEYFRVLRVAPAAGRAFRTEDDVKPAGHPIAMVSDALARRAYANQDPVGGTIRVNDVPLTIIGVLPAGFRGLSGKADLWLPRMMAPLLTYSEYLTSPQHFIMAIGRLKPGVPFDTANAELAPIGAQLGEQFTLEPGAEWSVRALRLADARVDVIAKRSAYALLGAAVCVLLVACVNVASLLLARSRTRQREVAVRLAIGSSRSRLIRQLLTEGLLIAAASASGGIVLAYWGAAYFAGASPAVIASGRNDYAQLGAFATPMVDLRVLGFAVLLALATTLVFALAPAVAASRTDLVPALRQDDRTTPGRAFDGLVVAEVALAMTLFVTAGLLIESFSALQNRRVGFDPDRVLTFWVRPSNSKYQVADGPATVQRLLESVQRAPGVAVAAVNRGTPFYGGSRTVAFFPSRPVANPPVVGRHYISADYFRVLGIPLLAGRLLTAADRAGTAPVTVINETAARRFWPGESAIGKRVWFGTTTGPFSDPSRAVEVVGIVGDVKYDGADQPMMADFYTSFLQFSYPDTIVLVKTQGRPADALRTIRAAIATVDSALPIYDVLTLDDRIDGILARPRFNASVVGAFALIALALAALGVYSVLAFSVLSRAKEVAVRIALGADGGRVIAMVLREGLILAGIGVAAGLAAAVGAGRLLQGLLFGVAAVEPWLLALGSIVMLIVAALAALIPARRAARVDPMVVLRE
jgi:predicted permease